MLTLFTVPKPSSGHVGVIQRNAILSWARLGQGCQIVLCADEKGTRELAEMVGGVFLSGIERNAYGTPLLSSVFAEVVRVAQHSLLCYLNSDIIVFPDFLDAVRRVRRTDFLMIGRRTRVDITEPVRFHDPGWEKDLRTCARTTGTVDNAACVDYMVFSAASTLTNLPPFAVGRPYWDDWFVERALRCGIPVIDASSVVLALHQNHDYSHVPQARGSAWEGPEMDVNRDLAFSQGGQATIEDATHYINKWGLWRHRHSNKKMTLLASSKYAGWLFQHVGWPPLRMPHWLPRLVLGYLPRLARRWRRKLRIGAMLFRRCPDLLWPYALGRLRTRPLQLLSALRPSGEE